MIKRGRQGPSGNQGERGKRGKTGPPGFPGRRGKTGAAGRKGPKGITGPIERDRALELIEDRFADVSRHLDIQMRRIAQIQVQLYQLAGKLDRRSA
jgi:Collagen triple helix repeat (20 copies)